MTAVAARDTAPWIFWPFAALWDLLAAILLLTGRVLAAILGVVLIVFILLNAQEVEIDFIVGTATAPLIFALAIAGVLGFAAGWLAPGGRGRRKDHE